ncbi:hypothetical protein K431DRAFT_300361 [Polychaeton citri CBS 116435]|uniref:Ricin B lectin domain-containing protein n=1 Tax=Polychaeton citri CBS 116435 TaxID=1314669 RepID=A0A9P4UUA0_9PEZI|nr:hypothetical protein K431DRAFT_300361 [Polychaeton citri CBS 116435]
MRAFAIALLAATAAIAKADLVCQDWTPYNFTGPDGRIHFFGNNPTNDPAEGPNFDAPTLPTNALSGQGAARIWKLPKSNKTEGVVFNIKTCNSTSLGFSTQVQSSCGRSGCYHDYQHNIQVINPHTGRCLTALPYVDVNGTATSTASFKTCNKDPKDLSQIWFSNQQVVWPCCSYNGNPISSYGPTFYAKYGNGSSSLFPALSLSRSDNRTIQLVMDEYNQVGLGASILSA